VNPFFSFKSKSSSGVAYRGRVELSAGSLSNRAFLFLDPAWEGSLSTRDSISLEITAFDELEGAYSFPCFEGVVTQILPKGDSIYVECVTVGSYLLVKSAPVKSWSNTTASSVFKFLLGLSGAKSAKLHLPGGFGGDFLHVWNTDGGTLAEEIYDLFAAHMPGCVLFSSGIGHLMAGTRDDLGKLLQPWPFPSDVASTLVSGVVDSEASQFSLRPASPHQVVYVPEDKSFLGTLDSVCHEIRPGRARTDIVIDRSGSSALTSYLKGL
jgi:hypothetical protein